MNKDDFFKDLSSYNELKVIGPMPLHKPAIIDGPVIYVDGGLNHRPTDSHFNISIGDNDSNKTGIKLDVTLSTDKSFSDLTYVLSLIPEHVIEIDFFGFLGGRLDHQFIAIGSVHHFLKKRALETTCRIENNIMAISSGQISFEHNGIFSVLCLEEQEITITGDCRYEISQPTKIEVLSCRTLSNEAAGKVTISCESPLFIFFENDSASTPK